MKHLLTLEFDDADELRAALDLLDGAGAPAKKSAKKTTKKPPVEDDGEDVEDLEDDEEVEDDDAVTLESLQETAMALKNKGKGGKVKALLETFGTTSISKLPKAKYEKFAAALAKIK